MTIEEARDAYSVEEDGYILCDYCPVSKKGQPCASAMTGYDDCWEKIATFKTANDVVNHPTHYTQGEIECIDAMKAAFGANELSVYCKIAAFKYIWRCEHKNGTEDVKKAVWYLNKYIELKEGGTDDPMRKDSPTP